MNRQQRRASARGVCIERSALEDAYAKGYEDAQRTTARFMTAAACLALKECFGFGAARICRVLTVMSAELTPQGHITTREAAQDVLDQTGVELDLSNPIDMVRVVHRSSRTLKEAKIDGICKKHP